MRPWLLFSSSSGETFKALYKALPFSAQSSLKAFFTDRPCEAAKIARVTAPQAPVYELERKSFESQFLDWKAKQKFEQEPIILLCGFFGILSDSFLKNCACPVLNTHPSLLPAFPGLDKKVHELASQNVSISGFTLHMVTAALDGGPILFQHPVWIDPRLDVEDIRMRVREAEQKWLPRIFSKILESELGSQDALLNSKTLRLKHQLFHSSFLDSHEIKDQ